MELERLDLMIDLLINNAGLGLAGDFLSHDLAEELASIEVMCRLWWDCRMPWAPRWSREAPAASSIWHPIPRSSRSSGGSGLRWAKRGTRPSAPNDQRTSSAYIFGAICPAEGKGAGLVLPSCNSEDMALHLEEISLAVVDSRIAASAVCRPTRGLRC
jgi:hypothetical protein